MAQAKLARNKNGEAEVKEEIELAIQAVLTKELHKGKLTTEKIIEGLEKELKGVIFTEVTDEKIKGEYRGYEFEISNHYKVTIIGKVGMNITYELDPKDYTTESVTITLYAELAEGITIKSITPQTEGIETLEENWKFKVEKNGLYQFKAIDNNENEKNIIIPIENIDTDAPVTKIELINDTNFINGKIKAKVTTEDEKSGVDITNCKWVINQSNKEIGTNPALYTGGTLTSEAQEIETTNLTKSGSYYFHILAIDKLGNKKEYLSEKAIIKEGYTISTPQDLQNIKNNLSANYFVTNDIDMKNFNFTPIEGKFTGSIDGQGYTIANLKITLNTTKTNDSAAIFKIITGNAKISNILFKNVDILGKDCNAATIAGSVEGNTNIFFENVGITGKVTGKCSAGYISKTALRTSADKITFKNCYAKVNVSDSKSDGPCYDGAGFAGVQDSANLVLQNCYWSGTNNKTKRSSSFVSLANPYNNDNQLTSNTVTVNNCYYDKQKYPLNIAPSLSGNGVTTVQMKNKDTYVGWDFDNIWYMGEDGYPELR